MKPVFSDFPIPSSSESHSHSLFLSVLSMSTLFHFSPQTSLCERTSQNLPGRLHALSTKGNIVINYLGSSSGATTWNRIGAGRTGEPQGDEQLKIKENSLLWARIVDVRQCASRTPHSEHGRNFPFHLDMWMHVLGRNG